MKKVYIIVALLLFSLVTTLTSCNKATKVDGSFEFIIYESDSDNSDLSDNKVVVTYTIRYVGCKTVTDALIQKGDKYYFSDDSNDYLVLVDSGYGLSYAEGYFANYLECSSGKAIDVSCSYTAVNGKSATKGIGETPLDGLVEFGFVINGWK